MENASQALIIAFSIIIFVIALTISISMFSMARATSDFVIFKSDKTNYYEYNRVNETSKRNARVVSMEAIVPTLYRYYKENYRVEFYDNEGKQLEIYEKVGYIDSLAVNQDYAGKGIGTLLLKNTILKLKENNINFVLMAAWKNITEVNIKALAKKEGFKEEFEIKNFWREDSIKEKFDCTVCGKPPCLCSAVIYTKELNS